MKSTDLVFNILNFSHPVKELSFYFTNKEEPGLTRLFHSLVPDEVIKHFGEQEHFYTSFDQRVEGYFAITKPTTPKYETIKTEAYTKTINNSAYSAAILKRYYNQKIHQYFNAKGIMTKPNFVHDVEIWLPINKDFNYQNFEKYTLRVQFKTVTKNLEILISYDGKSKIFLKNASALMEHVSPTIFNWVIYQEQLYKYHELPNEATRELSKVFPVWNFDLRTALKQATPAPARNNRYTIFRTNILKFINNYLDNEDFKEIIPITSSQLAKVSPIKIGHVSNSSNQLLFGNNRHDIVPINGMKQYGPLENSPLTKIHLFYIFHEDDKKAALKFNDFLSGKEPGFNGFERYTNTSYYTEKNFSVPFKNKSNPYPEIESQLNNKHFNSDVNYIAIYLSPFNKDKATPKQKNIYYLVKELLLKKGITSQVIEASKVLTNTKYHYSMPNIAIAMLAKLDGEPWRLDRPLKNELIIGVGAFKNSETNIKYIGSAFSFQNNGRFNRFEIFQDSQTEVLAGSILNAIREYVSLNSNLNRLIIHFFKNMSRKEIEPIEQGLRKLDLDIPIFILAINKTESNDIIAFDNEWNNLMPQSGTYINIGWNKFLLFNNTRYSEKFNPSDGYPFPIKINITCNKEELAKDQKTIKELLDQVYQFSRMYWKSVSQQNLPVTIKYPAMVAEIFPHFSGHEIPDFGKENLWFL